MVCLARAPFPWRLWTSTASGLNRKPASPRRADPPVIELNVGEETYAVRLRRIRTARRFTLQVHGTRREAVLTLPVRGSLAQARALRRRSRRRGWRNGCGGCRRPFRLSTAPSFPCAASIIASRIGRRRAARCGWRPVGTASGFCVAGGESHMARRIEDFLKREARRDLAAAVTRHAADAEA